MANISFFLSSDDMPIQLNNQPYGPVLANEDTQYRVTSRLPLVDKNLYAACEGEVIVCNSSNTDYVNIYLKPFINYGLYRGISKVKYFVYRGVKKTSFFNTDGTVKTTQENDILKSLNKGVATTSTLSPADRRTRFKNSFDAIVALAVTYPDPNNSAVNLDNLIDPLFVQEDYNQIHIDQGAKLGLGGSEFGFEVMLEENGFNPTIAQARLLDNVIDTASDATVIEKEVRRLEVLNYIDPAAFYGLFTPKGVFEVADPKGGKPKTESGIYSTFISKFFTKNSIYIDIRNKFNLPPYVGVGTDVFTDIKISTNGSSPTVQKKYKHFHNGTTEFNTWPIFIVNTGFSNRESPASSHQFFQIKISLPKIYTNSQILHVLSNHLKDSWPIKREGKFNLDQRYAKLSFSGAATWSNSVTLSAFARYNTNNIVATLIRLEYAEYTDENKIKDQILSYKLHELTAETFSNQLSPTLVNLGKTDELTRGKDATTGQNTYKTSVDGLGKALFSETRGIGCELSQGKAIDSVGEICFAYRTANTIKATGITLDSDRLANKGAASNQLNKDIFKQAFGYNKIQKSFEDKVQIDVKKKKAVFRKYEEFLEIHNAHRKNKSILSVHKVQFSDGGNKNGIELRVNDPIVLKGLTGNSPAECLLSIAYTYAQRDTIVEQIKTHFLTSRFVTFVSDTSTEITTAGRKVFKQTFKLLGLKANGSDLALQEQVLSLSFYSLDGANFVTPEYADVYRNEVGAANDIVDRVLTNAVVPDFIVGDSFAGAGFAPNTYTAVKALLTTISSSGTRDRILYNEIRDYIYDGDLDSLTFEAAFRLPFYTEDPSKVPYTQVTINAASVPNNPFIDFFEQDNTEEWFTLANTLRANQVSPVLESLARSGLTASTSIKKSYEKEFFDAANTKQETYFVTVNLPVNAATTFNWENPKSYFEKHGKKPHLPYGKNDASATVNTYSLSHLETATVITAAQKTTLAAVPTADFGYEEITNGTYTINGVSTVITGKYVFTEKNESTYKIYDFTWTNNRNNSGITFGLGYDIGGRSSYTKLLDYINVQSSTVSTLKETVLKKGLGKHKIEAQREFFPFKKAVWNTISLDYNITIDKTKPILQDEYLFKVIPYIVSSRANLKIYKSTEATFYKNDSLNILNLAELCVYSTFVWNRGKYAANLNSSKSKPKRMARLLIHAFNTHDIRWLRYFVEKSGIYHAGKVTKLLAEKGIIEHYRK